MVTESRSKLCSLKLSILVQFEAGAVQQTNLPLAEGTRRLSLYLTGRTSCDSPTDSFLTTFLTSFSWKNISPIVPGLRAQRKTKKRPTISDSKMWTFDKVNDNPLDIGLGVAHCSAHVLILYRHETSSTGSQTSSTGSQTSSTGSQTSSTGSLSSTSQVPLLKVPAYRNQTFFVQHFQLGLNKQGISSRCTECNFNDSLYLPWRFAEWVRANILTSDDGIVVNGNPHGGNPVVIYSFLFHNIWRTPEEVP